LQFTAAETAKSDSPVITDKSEDVATTDTTPQRDAHALPSQEQPTHGRPPPTQAKPPPGAKQKYYQQFAETPTIVAPIVSTAKQSEPAPYVSDVTDNSTPSEPPKLKTEREGKLQTDGNSALQFSRDDSPPQGQPKRPKPNSGITEPVTTNNNAGTPQSPLNFDKPEKLHFTADTDDSSKPSDEPNKQRQPQPQPSADSPSDDTTPEPPKPQEQHISADTPATPSTPSTAQSPLKESESALKPDTKSKLKFKPEDTPPANPKSVKKLERLQKQADKSVAKLETAQAKLPAKKKLQSKVVINEKTGKPGKKLYFESQVKPMGEHLKGAKPLRPIKTAANSALMFGHGKVFQVERENTAVQAAHKGEMIAESGVRIALRHHKTAPYRKVQKLQRTAQKKSVNLAYQKALSENPKLKSNILSRAFQKRKIKKDYAKAAREAQKAAKRAKKAGATVTKGVKMFVRLLAKNPKVLIVSLLIGLILVLIMTLFTMCASIGSGGFGGILTASYLAEDVDIDKVSVAYTEWETDLKTQIQNTETTYPGYDEYRYNIGEISHNPFEMMAYLTALYQNFPYDAISADLLLLFNEQYALTNTPSVETRYRTITVTDPVTGESTEEQEAYDWHVLTVTLTSRSLSEVIVSRLSGDRFAHYALLLQTMGARQIVGNPFGFDWLPHVSSYYGYRIHPISGAKDLHRGIDIGIAAGTSILSAQDGTVTFAGNSGGYGNVVVIENEHGIVTKYAHCETILVTEEQPVKIGDTIATVGSTGNSTGPHLHFEVLKDGQYMNPLFFADTGSFNVSPVFGFAGVPMGDGTFAAMITEAEKYLGYPYVWGGSSPATSFDCSGFVSWVINQSGAAIVGRQTAQGLFNLSNPVLPIEARPGDLIFFHSTYSAPHPVTHVGIYVGGSPPMMIHAGNPISYVRIDTTYWQNHFYAYGRLN